MAAGINIAFKIAAKPLQIEIWLDILLTVYNSSSPYPTVGLPVLSQAPYDVGLQFSNNTSWLA